MMFFKVCREDLGGSESGRKQNVFHPGCTNFKKCNVQKHQEIENHQHAMAKKKTGEAEPGTERNYQSPSDPMTTYGTAGVTISQARTVLGQWKKTRAANWNI